MVVPIRLRMRAEWAPAVLQPASHPIGDLLLATPLGALLWATLLGDRPVAMPLDFVPVAIPLGVLRVATPPSALPTRIRNTRGQDQENAY
jgi:hypothetical protein